MVSGPTPRFLQQPLTMCSDHSCGFLVTPVDGGQSVWERAPRHVNRGLLRRIPRFIALRDGLSHRVMSPSRSSKGGFSRCCHASALARLFSNGPDADIKEQGKVPRSHLECRNRGLGTQLADSEVRACLQSPRGRSPSRDLHLFLTLYKHVALLSCVPSKIYLKKICLRRVTPSNIFDIGVN